MQFQVNKLYLGREQLFGWMALHQAMYKVLDLLEGQGRTDSASSWGLHRFKVIRLVSKEYVYVVHNASLNTVEF